MTTSTAAARYTIKGEVVVRHPGLTVTLHDGDDYVGGLEWTHVWMRGKEIIQLGRAWIRLDEKLLIAGGYKGSAVEIDLDVTKFVLSGEIAVVHHVAKGAQGDDK